MFCLALIFAAAVAGHPDVALITRMLAGHRGATRVLGRRLLPVVQARAWRRLQRAPQGVRGVVSAEDLAQEAWARLLKADGKALRAFDPTAGVTLEGYVGMLAERAVLNALEGHVAGKRGGGEVHAEITAARDVTGADDGGRAEARDTLRGLSAHLAEQLPPKGMLVFRLLYTDGLSVKEAAQAMGANAQVIYNWQHKIRKAARAFLEAHG